MKKMFYYSFTLLCCLLMTALYAGVASNTCEKLCTVKKCSAAKAVSSQQVKKKKKEKEPVADFIFTNRVLLF